MKRLFLAIFLFLNAIALAQSTRWSEKQAADWYSRQPWLVGSNYIPSYAINQLEMWQEDTFNPARIDIELGYAEGLGMNTMRVFLHDQVWQQDSGGFKKRIDRFLTIAKKHKIRPILVLFDSCWNPFPEAGIQRPPRPGVHNSGWVQSPGAKALADEHLQKRFLTYAQQVVLAFANDDRILAWDVWNEPDNTNSSSYGTTEPRNKVAMVQAMLPKAFEYVRAGLPSQPITSGLWHNDWSDPSKLTPIEKMQIELSDVISFHSYGKPEDFEKRIQSLQPLHRPILCTEYMARTAGSTFQGILPIAQKYNVAAINWGLVAGKTQTVFPWDSWKTPYTSGPPTVWFHDIFTVEGQPYSREEVDFIRNIISQKSKGKAAGK